VSSDNAPGSHPGPLLDLLRLAIAEQVEPLRQDVTRLLELVEDTRQRMEALEGRLAGGQLPARAQEAELAPAGPEHDEVADGPPPRLPGLWETLSGRRQGRRLATVMFADVSGFTTMSETMEPEDVQAVMNRIFEPLTQEIEAAGGWVDKYIGDCVMAVFGTPRAMGDDASRAAQAALRMQAELHRLAGVLSAELDCRVAMRIGLNTGVVQAGEVGGGERAAYTVMGDTVNTANRIESACEVGGVLVSAATQRQIAERFVLEPAGSISVKGKKEEVEAWHLLRARDASLTDWTFSFEGRPIPFVGRDRELEALGVAFSEAIETRRPRLVILGGPSGIGKTRLTVEFAQHAARAYEVLVLHGRGTGHKTGLPFDPIIRSVQEWLELQPGDPRESLFESWQAGRAHDDVSDAFDEAMLHLLQRWVLARERDGARLDVRDLETDKRLLFRTLATVLARLRPGAPVVLALSNLGAVDPLTLECLEHWLTTEHSPDMPVLIVGEVTMPDEGGGQTLSDVPGVRTLDLPTLPSRGLEELTDRLLHSQDEPPEWIRDWAVPQCAGNPAFLIEHLRSLVCLNVLEIDETSGRWRLPRRPPGELSLPPSVHGAAQAILDSLGREEHAVVTVGSVVGMVFWDVIVSDLVAGWLTPDEVDRALSSLVERGYLRRRHESMVRDATEYRFVTVALRRVAEQGVRRKLAAEIHLRAAECLLAWDTSGELRALAGDHFDEGGDPARSLGARLDALVSLVQRGALRDATVIADLVDATLTGAGDSLPAADLRLARLRLAVGRTQLHRFEGRYEEAMASADKALGEEASAQAPVDQHLGPLTRWRMRLLAAAGDVLSSQGRWDDALERFDAAHALEQAGGHSAGEAHLGLVAGRAWALVQLKRLDEAESLLLAELASYEERKVLTLPGPVQLSLARLHDGVGELRRRGKDLPGAAQAFERARALRLVDGNPRLLSVSDNNLALVSALSGDWAGAADRFSNILALREGWGTPQYVATARTNLAECLLRSGDLEAGHGQLARALEQAERHGMKGVLQEIEALGKEFPEA